MTYRFMDSQGQVFRVGNYVELALGCVGAARPGVRDHATRQLIGQE